jgi:hypothetical protein
MTSQQPPESDRLPQVDGLCSPIVELRQYTLYPGTRDAFAELFDREFVETQEAAGMRIIGQFRDLGDPNRYVWLRAFADMPARKRALNAFYIDGPAWAAHSETARSMMIDTSDALLLHPVRPEWGFALDDPTQRPPLESATPNSIVVAMVHHLAEPASAVFLDFYEDSIVTALRGAGARVLGLFATEHSPNNFPRLPLRERENVFVAFCGFDDLATYHRHMTTLGRDRSWRQDLYPELTRRLTMPPQTLRLAPTSRSQLPG